MSLRSLNTLGARISLSARLATISGVIGAAVVTLAAAIGYFALDHQLDARALAELQGKRQLVRHLIAEFGTAENVAANAQRFSEPLIGHDDLHLAILDTANGHVLASFSELARQSIRCCDGAGETGGAITWRNVSGDLYTSLADTWSVANGDKLYFMLLHDRKKDVQLLQGYWRMAFVGMLLLMGFVLCGAWGIARAGLAPLAKLKTLAQEISTTSLAHRLDSAQMPRELRDLANDFNGMLERMEVGINQLNQFSADLAHEMRTPIAILLGRTQVALSRKRSDVELLDVLEAHVEDLDRLARLIDDMLFLARAENEVGGIATESLDLGAEASKIADFMEIIASERSVGIEVRGVAPIHANKMLLQRALTNLLSNAIRHSADHRTIQVTASSKGGFVLLAVENIGPPIPSEDLSRIFDRFYRLDNTRARVKGGTGLGLSIVRTIARLHGGKVEVTCSEDTDGNGVTRFELSFPRN